MSKLSEDEREMLSDWWLTGSEGDLHAVVEAILTARLARVEALADDWARGLAIDNAHPMEPVSRLLAGLRAALAAAPSREADQ